MAVSSIRSQSFLHIAVVAVVLATPVLGQSQDLYRWVDEQGRVQYSDQPPPGVDADSLRQSVPELPASGVRLANPQSESERSSSTTAASKPKRKKEDSLCRQYHSDLNRVELYLRHTPNQLDEQRAKDLQAQIEMECRGFHARASFANSRCRRYQSRLNRLLIFHKHSPNERDRKRIADLRGQIDLEC